MEYPRFENDTPSPIEEKKTSPIGENWEEKMNQIPFFAREDGIWREEVIPRVNDHIQQEQTALRASLSLNIPSPDFGKIFDAEHRLRRMVYEDYLSSRASGRGKTWDQQLADAPMGKKYEQTISQIAERVFAVWKNFKKRI